MSVAKLHELASLSLLPAVIEADLPSTPGTWAEWAYYVWMINDTQMNAYGVHVLPDFIAEHKSSDAYTDEGKASDEDAHTRAQVKHEVLDTAFFMIYNAYISQLRRITNDDGHVLTIVREKNLERMHTALQRATAAELKRVLGEFVGIVERDYLAHDPNNLKFITHASDAYRYSVAVTSGAEQRVATQNATKFYTRGLEICDSVSMKARQLDNMVLTLKSNYCVFLKDYLLKTDDAVSRASEVCVRVCACMCMCVHVCVCVCMYVYVCACMCMCVKTRMQECVCMHESGL
jgi:hypothetical protein